MKLNVQFIENTQTFNSSFNETINIGGSSETRSSVKLGWVTLLANAWEGTEHPYHQVVEIDGVTRNSQVDLTPDVEQLMIFYEKDLSFVTENEDGRVTVYAIGQKPANDHIVQVTITEVAV